MWKYKGLLALTVVVTVHLMSAFGLSSSVYYVYSNFIFPVIRSLYDYTLGFLPFGFLYILVIGLIGFLVYRKVKKSRSQKWPWQSRLMMTINIFGWIIFLFYFLWGFNYNRASWVEKNDWTEVSPDSILLFQEMQTVSEKVNEFRKRLSLDTSAMVYHPDWTMMENDIRSSQTSFLKSYGDHVNGRVRIRRLYPKGLLMSLSTAGIYIPFVCEGHIDPGLNPIQWPFTVAHEMAHGYGYTDEGECNFIGFVTCIQSTDPYIQYSGWLGYWRYLYREVYQLSEEKSDMVYASMTPGVQADLRAIRKDINRYPDIMPWFRDVIYEFYLRSHGMSDGLASYDGIISLVLTWKEENSIH